MRINMKSLCSLLAATLVGCLMASPVSAAALPPGTALFGPSTETDPVGATSVTSLTAPFSVPGAFSGTLKTEVFSGDTSNLLGGLTFVYTLTNDGVAGTNSIGRLSISEFAGFSLDASYQIPVAGGTVAPASIDRNPVGDVVGFNFVPVGTDPATGFLSPGMSSAALVVQTGVTSYATGTFGSLIDGGVGTVDAIVPVPEPSSVALTLIGLAAASLYTRRRS